MDDFDSKLWHTTPKRIECTEVKKTMNAYVVSALYKFTRLEHFRELKDPLLKVMKQHQLNGTLLLAHEGINGTVAGSPESMAALYAWFAQNPPLHDIVVKESHCAKLPFKRAKVKLKKEIVTLGVDDIDPTQSVGTYVTPAAWNDLISSPDVTVVDTRNDYEVQIGTFAHAINPHTTTFREFPEFVENHLNPEQHRKVAMFCTGGIRCEKSTAYLKKLGFNEVYHLQGGILNYLKEVPPTESLWKGECFVFDERVTVDHHLNQGQYDQCYACRYPITDEDKRSSWYIKGVSCPHCATQKSTDQQARFREREKQSQLAKGRGEVHIGGEVSAIIQQRRAHKKQRNLPTEAN